MTLRYGTNGSLSVDLEKGIWFSFEEGKGGGVLDLVKHLKGLEGAAAVDWMRRDLGIGVDSANGALPSSRKISATYDYVNEALELVFQVVRFDPKDFRQRRPDSAGGWEWSVRGVRQVPYRLPDLQEAIASDRTVVIVEGEKDVEALWTLNIPATTNAGGAGKWSTALNEFFRDVDVVIVPDNDPPAKNLDGTVRLNAYGKPIFPGQDHARAVARSLGTLPRKVRILELPDSPLKGDVSDWISAGGTADEFWRLVETAGVPSDEYKGPRVDIDIGSGEPRPPLQWLDMSAWDTELVPERKWAIRDRVPLNQAGLFSGEGGTGKSIIELMKNVAHVAGKDWLGSLPEQGPSFYVGTEEDKDEIHIRFATVAEHYGVPFEELVRGGLKVLCLLGQDATLCALGKGGRIETTKLYRLLYEAAGDLKPKNISIDTLSRAFAGNEIDRVQVYAFAQHMQALAKVATGSVTVLSHPSLSGVSSGSGLSGSTAWHGAFRFRHYLRGVKAGEGEQPDGDLRELQFLKNQYGPRGETIVLRYQRGLFVPEGGMSSFDRIVREAKVDEVFVTLLRRFTDQNRNVSLKISANSYAPREFVTNDLAKQHSIKTAEMAQSMERLLTAGKIINETYGKPAKPYQRLVVA
jgi:RecA-family ATPase